MRKGRHRIERGKEKGMVRREGIGGVNEGG
jgi:hypothetical protein